MTKQLNFKRCKAFIAMLLVLCNFLSIFSGIGLFNIEKAQAKMSSYVIYVEKTDPDGNLLGGAELELANAYGNPISIIEYVKYGNFNENGEFVANEDYSKYDEVSSFVTMEGYVTAIKTSRVPFYLREISAPEGYDIAEDVMIASADLEDDNTAHVTMIDHKKTINNPSGENDEPNKPLSTDDEVVNKGEDIEVAFNNHIHTVQNLTVSKVLKEELLDGNLGESLSEAEFNFKAYFSNMKEGDAFNAYNGEGDDAEVVGTVTADANGEAEFAFNLKNKESVVFNEMPIGVQYQIEEILDADDGTAPLDFEPAYLVSGIIEGKNAETGNRGENLITEVQTLEAREEGSVIFTNTKVMDYGKLEIVKKVEGTPANPNEVFQFTVKLDGDLIVEAPMKFKAVKTVGEDATVEEASVEFINKEATVELKAGESIEITLPAGTTYEVIEAENDAYDVTYEVEELGAGPGENVGPGGASTYAGDYNKWVKTTYNLKVYKVDQDMNPVKDATLQLIKKDSNAVETQWVSTNEPHLAFSGEYQAHSTYFAENILEMLAGEFDFVLKEVNAPDDYKIASDIDLSYERLLLWQFYDRAYEIDEEMSAKLGMEVEKVSDGIYFNQTFDENYNYIDTFIVFMVDESEENIDSGDTPEPDAPSKHEKAEGFIAPDSHSKVTVTNSYKSGKLVVTKEVVGNEDTQQSFQFTITLTGDEIGGVQTFDKDKSVEFNDGVGVIYLKNGESKEFDLPDGTTYKVEETQYESYDASYSEEVIDPYAVMPMNVLETYLTVHKVDENGNYVEGAVLQLIDTNGEIREEWTTSNGSHEIWFWWGDRADGYVLHEVKAPEGYKSAEDIVIDTTNLEWDYDNPNNDDEVNFCYKISMIDKTISYKDVVIHKVDNKDDYVQGATLQLINASTYEVVDEWITDNAPHTVTVDDAYNYIVREVSAPEGYTPASDITFNPKETTEVTMINVKNNKNVTIKKVDKNDAYVQGATLQVLNASTNEVVAEWVSGNGEYIVSLDPDYSYILHEASAPEGYELAEDITFNPNDVTEVTMVNNKIKLMFMRGTIERDIYKVVKVTNTYIPTEDEVAILKVDSDNNPLAGATLQIIDAEGNVVDEWVSTNEEHRISLAYGTYTLHEAKAPRGYRLAEDIEFTVAEGSYNTVIMVDPPISVMVSTGGTGTIITIALAVVFGCATGFLVYMGKKKEKEEAQASENSDSKETKTE